ncbi:DUF1566 domain-containing protein [Paraburkholderia acidisoli]|uniref:DUF1566 domain-containing protein n=1 Tax=Paraburkholderia acidisoli TaxID=2571748 RepID=A0A7Z2GQW1_9BURK|nr:DUF1566 domain-containing protein [Paraburkholderia acidisoli]QGZ66316.1 DUF1566 domain-containing protein [Paraburkholderia acidisoli]QGZ66401.1 DUF1566 domain-containing protein [Paraburkholderia acidisoli]
MTITLEAIEAKQSEISKLIESFKKQSTRSTITILGATIKLEAGEHYAGIILGDDGQPLHHLILLPGDVDEKSWSDAKSWAAEQGGELPTRREQSLLFANLKQCFESRYYWSAEERESDSAYAWCQDFDDGFQYDGHKASSGCRARAVRRIAVGA